MVYQARLLELEISIIMGWLTVCTIRFLPQKHLTLEYLQGGLNGSVVLSELEILLELVRNQKKVK